MELILTITRAAVLVSALATAMALPIWSSPTDAKDEVRVSGEDGGDTAVIRTYDGKTGKLIKVVRDTETDDPNDQTKIWKKVTTKKYDQGKRPPYEILVEEQEIVLVNRKDGKGRKRVVRKRTKTSTTYTKNGEREPVIEVKEEMELAGLDANGKPIYDGTRVTTRWKNHVIPEKNEVWNAKEGKWVALPPGSTLDQFLEAQRQKRLNRPKTVGTNQQQPTGAPIGVRPVTNRPRYLVDDPLNRTKIIKEKPAKAEGRQVARPEDRKAARKPSPKTACDALGGEWHSGTLEQVRQIVKDWQKALSRCTAGTDDCRTYRGGLSIQSYMKILTVWQCHVTFFRRAKTASKDDRKKAHEEACAIENTLEKIAEQIKATGIMKAGAGWKPYHIDIRDKLGMKGTCAPGQFKEAGGHYRKDPKTSASSIAEAKPKKKCRNEGVLGAINCVTSKIEGAGSGPGKPPASASARDAATAITTRSERNLDGSHTITRTDKNGKVLSTETVGKGQASASSTDPATGITTRSEQNPDGTRTVTRTDKSGNVLSREKIGKRPASASATDEVTGAVTTSVANPDGTRTITKTDAQGNILSREKVR